MATLLRTEFPAFSAKFSPFHPDRVAIGTSQYFGIVGNGKQVVASITPTGQVIETHGCVCVVLRQRVVLVSFALSLIYL